MKAILLAEDDPLVRSVLAIVLTEICQELVEATTGTEALRLLERDQFDAVVSDMKMPGAGGIVVLEEARKRSERTRLVLISGYASEEAQVAVQRLGGVVLHKPFGSAALREALLGQHQATLSLK